MKINIIVAMDSNGVIGYRGKMPWNLPPDLKRFKELTTNSHVIMGRKTYDSIGKPLAKRRNYVITRNPEYILPNNLDSETVTSHTSVIKVGSLREAIYKAYVASNNPHFNECMDKYIWIIGGEQIFEQAINFADAIYITHIMNEYTGDTFFPEFNKEDFVWKNSDYEIEQYDDVSYIPYYYSTGYRKDLKGVGYAE